MRRLNRYEYENTLQYLFAAPSLQLRDSLLEDGISHRFNKSGEALDVSHVQMARYLDTAEQALRDVLRAQQSKSDTERFYARDQKRMIRHMTYGPFKFVSRARHDPDLRLRDAAGRFVRKRPDHCWAISPRTERPRGLRYSCRHI
ncbi:MAG: DUF1587 domain-containing protein [Acidobacteria bacterium]|nr:DUF1587 domain-containing protein [Acidobacteriota bacterium]